MEVHRDGVDRLDASEIRLAALGPELPPDASLVDRPGAGQSVDRAVAPDTFVDCCRLGGAFPVLAAGMRARSRCSSGTRSPW